MCQSMRKYKLKSLKISQILMPVILHLQSWVQPVDMRSGSWNLSNITKGIRAGCGNHPDSKGSHQWWLDGPDFRPLALKSAAGWENKVRGSAGRDHMLGNKVPCPLSLCNSHKILPPQISTSKHGSTCFQVHGRIRQCTCGQVCSTNPVEQPWAVRQVTQHLLRKKTQAKHKLVSTVSMFKISP